MKSAIVSGLLLTQQISASSWDYDDQEHWEDDYSMCNNDDQSPINILTDEAIYDDDICGPDFEWDFDYDVQTFKISNNGHSVSLQPVQLSNIDDDGDLSSTLFGADGAEYVTLSENENTIARFTNYLKPEDSDHDEFCLHSLHFHWGEQDIDGSEHFINGNQYALEVHFVHYSCEHADLTTTLLNFQTEDDVNDLEDAGVDTHQLGVVGIFFDVREDESNPVFDTIFDNLEDFELPAQSGDPATIVTGIDLSELIPDDIEDAGYYAYEGSLTTPPCTNIVRWHVMNARSWIGAEQVAQFRNLMSSEDHYIAPNYRDIQPRFNNVYACMDEDVEGHDDVTVADEGVEAVIIEDDAGTKAVVWMVAAFAVITPVVLGTVCCWLNKREKEQAEQPPKTESK